jgi:hypothetical protein
VVYWTLTIKWKEPEEKKRPWTPIWTPRPLKRRNLAGQEGFEPPTLGFGGGAKAKAKGLIYREI